MHDHIKTAPLLKPDSAMQLAGPPMPEDRVNALKTLIELVLRELESLRQVSDGPRFADAEALSLPEQMSEIEIGLIRNALEHAAGNQRTAATLLGIKHTTLHAKLRRYNIDPQAFVVGPRNRYIHRQAGF